MIVFPFVIKFHTPDQWTSSSSSSHLATAVFSPRVCMRAKKKRINHMRTNSLKSNGRENSETRQNKTTNQTQLQPSGWNPQGPLNPLPSDIFLITLLAR